MGNNQSVEELLRSLRSTVEKRASNNRSENVLELRNPINHYDEKCLQTDKIENNTFRFVEELIENAVSKNLVRFLEERPDLIRKSIEKILCSDQFSRSFNQICREHMDSENFEILLKSILEEIISNFNK